MTTFLREEWTLFRNLNTLGQKAGSGRDDIPKLVVKELVDNALDASGACQYGPIAPNGFYVENDGGGLSGSDAEIAELFSIARPLASSKLLRLPTRGALGNGLRVVVGAVLASGGELVVKTRGRALRLIPCDNGETDVERIGPWDGQGTRIEVCLGESLTVEEDSFAWARRAVHLAKGTGYKGKTSPWWYDADSFYDLCQAAGAITIRELVENFAGCCGAKAGRLTADLSGRASQSLSRDEAEGLLDAMRKESKPIPPKRLGAIGGRAYPSLAYAREVGTFTVTSGRGSLEATIPVVVEAWAEQASQSSMLWHVNATPITAEIGVSRCIAGDKSAYGIVGCGLSSEQLNSAFPIKASRGREFFIVVNITTPHMPITTDGKAPDLMVVAGPMRDAIEKAIRSAKKRKTDGSRQASQVEAITQCLPAAIDKASGNGHYRYSLRQLFYAVRPYILQNLGVEPDYGWFGRVVGDYEAQNGGDLLGMYRDDRGTLYHPHIREQIPLGTRSVEQYRRPEWTFNKVLYCEKEGFFPILIDAQWPERHDCALVTSKGYASRAARDVLDLLGDGDEPLTFYCLHDADGPGTMIYQTLQDGTPARPGRCVEIINLGLDPAEGVKMGLPVERFERKAGRAVPVAKYISGEWREWLQSNRIELNAMDTPMFLAWLDSKIGQSEKLVPPPHVLADRLLCDVRMTTQRRLVEEAVREARVDERTEKAISAMLPAIEKAKRRLPATVKKSLFIDPAHHWTGPVATLAGQIVSENAANVANRYAEGTNEIGRPLPS